MDGCVQSTCKTGIRQGGSMCYCWSNLQTLLNLIGGQPRRRSQFGVSHIVFYNGATSQGPMNVCSPAALSCSPNTGAPVLHLNYFWCHCPRHQPSQQQEEKHQACLTLVGCVAWTLFDGILRRQEVAANPGTSPNQVVFHSREDEASSYKPMSHIQSHSI